MNRERFAGIFSIPDWMSLAVIGQGGIGSAATLALAKMGFVNITAYDPDHVSEENCGTQFFCPHDISARKVDAMDVYLREFAPDVRYEGVGEMFEPKIILNPDVGFYANIVISGVDSIASRKGIWTVLDSDRTNWDWYIDARMAAETLEIYAVNSHDADWYSKVIAGKNDGDIPDLPCTSKATYYTASWIAGVIGSLCRLIVTEQKVPRVVLGSAVDLTLMRIG